VSENNNTAPRCIALADDHPIVRCALVSALKSLGPNVSFIEAHDAASTLALAASRELDLLLMDLNMPGARGTDTVRDIRATAPLLPVAVISAEEDPRVVSALLAMGVCGFIPKSDSPNVIVSAVRLMLDGGIYVPPRLLRANGVTCSLPISSAAKKLGITERQLEVVRLLARGEPNKLIARNLGVTEGTIKVHLLAIFRALNVRNRTAAVIAAQAFLD
jgi:DNA-binding NarL/FixJ family response regulator